MFHIFLIYSMDSLEILLCILDFNEKLALIHPVSIEQDNAKRFTWNTESVCMCS